MGTFLRIIFGVFALLFLFGAIVQLNDPDPARWMAIYLAATVACARAVLDRIRWWWPAIIAAVAGVWALALAPRAFPNVRIPELFAAWEMANSRVEEGREMYGLLIIFLCMMALAIASYRGRRDA
jgi:hypothetical protein